MKRLYGAALAAHQRKVARRSGGAATTKAIARRGPSNITVRVAGGKPAKRHHRRRRGGGGGHSGGWATRAWQAGLAALWGWAKGNKADTLAKIPKLDAIGLEATLGLVGTWAVPHVPAGIMRKVVDHGSASLLTLSGYAFGRSNFQSADVAGADDLGDDDMSGPLDDAMGDDDMGADDGDDY